MKTLFFISFLMSSFLLYSQKPLSKVDSLQLEIRLLEQKLDARDKELIDLKKNQNTVYEKVLDIKEMSIKHKKNSLKKSLIGILEY